MKTGTGSIRSMVLVLTLVGAIACDDPQPKGGATGSGTTAALPTSTASAMPPATAAPTASAVATTGAETAIRPPTTTLADLSGEYEIGGGAKPDGSAYEGAVKLAKAGETYTLAWDIANNPAYKGVGLPVGDLLAVGYAEGETVGVSVYKVSGGTLEGHWASLGSKGKLGAETLEGPESLEGEFEIKKGVAPDGKTYAGKVTIKKTGDTFAVEWKLPEVSFSGAKDYRGTGIREGDHLLVGWGDTDKGAGVGAYKLTGDKLEGKWAGFGDAKLGKETLSKGAGDAKEGGEDDLMKEMMGE